MNSYTPIKAISVRKLKKSFGPTKVLKGIDLDCYFRQVLTVLGPNGAGKTTLLRILATITRPDFGEIEINGLSLKRQSTLIRNSIGFLAHAPMLYGDLTAKENLTFFSRMFRVGEFDKRIKTLASQLGFSNQLDLRIRNMSHGQHRRVALARTLLHSPQILLLDEPESGLDQQARAYFQEIVESYRSDGRSVIMTTHDIERGLELGNRFVIINKGKLVFDQKEEDVNLKSVREAYGNLMEKQS